MKKMTYRNKSSQSLAKQEKPIRGPPQTIQYRTQRINHSVRKIQ